MTRPRIKICGLTRSEDAAQAVHLGADALGFILWPGSPRAISPDAARAIAQSVPPLLVRVGVFVNASPHEVAELARFVGLDAVQLHGDEALEHFAAVPARVIRAIALESDDDVARASGWPSHVTPLVDASDPVRRGGTGREADWRLAADLAARRPIILAGGLSNANVARAIMAVRPWGVDVSSGVESAPGIKSAAKLEEFFAAVDAVTEDA